VSISVLCLDEKALYDAASQGTSNG